MNLLTPHSDKIVIFGQSCSGKTTFARTLLNHKYYCFDALFPWHSIETLGLSSSQSLKNVVSECTADRYVLDGWHLSDKQGVLLPADAIVYVLYCDYDKIIAQYRVPVFDKESHRSMFDRWYKQIDYSRFPKVRYFKNDSDFTEISQDKFGEIISS